MWSALRKSRRVAFIAAIATVGFMTSPSPVRADESWQSCLCEDEDRCDPYPFWRFCCTHIEGTPGVNCGCIFPLWGCPNS
jgi:hypothetical protein